MKPETLHTSILDAVRRQLKPREMSGLLRDLKRVAVLERKLIGTGGSAVQTKENAIAVADREMLDYLLTFCHSQLEPEAYFQVTVEIGDVFRNHGELSRAEELYTMSLNQGESAGDGAMIGEAYLRRGDVYGRLSRWKESTDDLNYSRKYFSELNEQVALGRIENILGTNQAGQGKLKKAKSHFQKALASFERHEQTVMTGSALMNLGIIYNIMGNYDSALAHYRRSQSYFEKVGDLRKLSDLYHNMGMSYLFKQEYKQAITAFDRCVGISTKTQNANVMGLASLGKANAYYHLKDMRMALTLVNQSLQSFAISNDRLSIADAYKVKGMIYRDMKKFSFAESFMQTSLRINLELKNFLNIAETYFEMGLLEKQRKNLDDARKALKEALAYFKKVGALDEVKRTENELALLTDKKKRTAA